MFKGSLFSEENSHLQEWRDGNNAIIAELEKIKGNERPNSPPLAQRHDQLYLTTPK